MTSPVRHRNILVAAIIPAGAVASHGTVIYRWVDENGRTHVSDAVPERYKKSATRIDSGQYDVSPERRKQAQEQAAREKALVDDAARRREDAPLPASAPAASMPKGSKRPAQGVTDSTDCETWRRLYRDSLECFGPYRTAKGATKAEAFEKSADIPDPRAKCGPVSE
jgi:hypothetical protein